MRICLSAYSAIDLLGNVNHLIAARTNTQQLNRTANDLFQLLVIQTDVAGDNLGGFFLFVAAWTWALMAVFLKL